MNYTLTTIFVLALAAAISSNGGVQGQSTHANIRGRELEQEDFDDLLPFSLSMSMPLSLSMSMSMPMDEELLVDGTTQAPPQEEGLETTISGNDGAVEINMTNPDLISPSADSSTTKTYIVTFADDDTTPPATRCAALAKSIGGTVDFVYTLVLKGCALTVPVAPQEDLALQQAQEVLMTLSDSPTVMTVEEDQIILLDPIVPSSNTGLLEMQVSAAAAPTSWGLDCINQCKLPLDQKTTKQDAKGVMVYIMDSGIRGDHKEFKGILKSNDKCHFSAYTNMPALRDVSGHGTHVAGTACGATYGVSSNCRLCSVKIYNDSGNTSAKAILAGLDHILATCVKSLCVVNMSIGGHYSEVSNKAVSNAVTKGIVVVAAAGNTGSDACAVSPASVPAAITVGSIDQSDKISALLTGESPWASNFGVCVDVYAPGSFIKSAFIDSTAGNAIMSGTSMAAPHVTGIAAAIQSAHNNWNPTQIRNAIVHSAVLLPSKLLLSTVDDIKCVETCLVVFLPLGYRRRLC